MSVCVYMEGACLASDIPVEKRVLLLTQAKSKATVMTCALTK